MIYSNRRYKYGEYFFVQSSPKWKLYIVSIKEYFFYANIMLRIRGYSFMKGIICVLPNRQIFIKFDSSIVTLTSIIAREMILLTIPIVVLFTWFSELWIFLLWLRKLLVLRTTLLTLKHQCFYYFFLIIIICDITILLYKLLLIKSKLYNCDHGTIDLF